MLRRLGKGGVDGENSNLKTKDASVCLSNVCRSFYNYCATFLKPFQSSNPACLTDKKSEIKLTGRFSRGFCSMPKNIFIRKN